MKEINCKIYEMRFCFLFLYLAIEKEAVASTLHDQFRDRIVITNIHMHKFKSYADVKRQLGRNLSALYIYSKKEEISLPLYYVLYHSAIKDTTIYPSTGDFGVLEDDIQEACSELELYYSED